MNFNYHGTDLQAPFSLLRELLPELDILAGTNWQDSSLTRAIFHRPGRDDELIDEAVRLNADAG